MLAKTSLTVAALLLAASATAAMAQPLSYWPDPFYPQMQYPVVHSRHYHVTPTPAWIVPAQHHYRTMPLDRDIYPGPRDR